MSLASEVFLPIGFGVGVSVSPKFDWFQKFPFRWTFYWLLLPNLVIILMWPIGGPPMRAPLILFGILAVGISQLPWAVARTTGLAALMLWQLVIYLASMFSIPTLNFGMFVQFLLDIRPMRAPEYVVGGLIFAALFAVTLAKAPRVARFGHRMQFTWAALAVFLFGQADWLVTARSSESYSTRADMPFSSAVRQARLAPGPAQRHVVVIVVEALGLPTAPEEKRLFEAAWHRPEWRRRYDLRAGRTPFFGSTTSGELRELCGQWSDHVRFDFAGADCLPERFREAGYATTAMHTFNGGLFNRTDWYPKLAFDTVEFAGDLQRHGAGQCDGVFPGACDTDVPAIIGRRLAAAERPQFVYWLTLNSHLPVVVDDDGDCDVGSAAWRTDFPRVCRMFEEHAKLAAAIDRMIMAPGLPPTDVLIVGDHKPPFFDRGSRTHFDASHVPWIYLRSRQPSPAPVGGAAPRLAQGPVVPPLAR